MKITVLTLQGYCAEWENIIVAQSDIPFLSDHFFQSFLFSKYFHKHYLVDFDNILMRQLSQKSLSTG